MKITFSLYVNHLQVSQQIISLLIFSKELKHEQVQLVLLPCFWLVFKFYETNLLFNFSHKYFLNLFIDFSSLIVDNFYRL